LSKYFSHLDGENLQNLCCNLLQRLIFTASDQQKPLKIFLIGPAFPLRGGLATFNELLCRALQQAGHDTRIVSFSLQYPSFLFPGTTQYNETGTAPADVRIDTWINSVNPFNWLSVGRRIKREKPDLLIIRFWLPFMGPALGTIARIARKNGHTRVVALVDNAIPHEKRPGDKAFARYFLRACHGYLTMSKSVLKDLQQFTDSPHKVFTEHPLYTSFGEPESKNAAREKLKLDAHGRYLLFFGLIRKYKGLDLLLEAMADERVKALGVKLIVAGEYYEDQAPYQAIIDRHGLADRLVMHTHFIADEDVRWYFSACDMVAQTYHTATQSGVTKIALQFNKPSLVTNVGGLGEIITHGASGYVVAPEVKAIADSITDYYEGQHEASFTEATVAEKKKYSWEVMCNVVTDLYKKIAPQV
jgi:D-inositol-3-phosphate glycosyltransferase